jgi:hypothetical protein
MSEPDSQLPNGLRWGHNVCCVCGGPGMTCTETGKWLCKRHSPYASTCTEPEFDAYLKKKSVDLFRLYDGILHIVNEMQSELEANGYCKLCGMEEGKHKDNCYHLRLLGLTDLSKTEYHPYFFWLEMLKGEPSIENSFLQDRHIYGQPSNYITTVHQALPSQKEVPEKKPRLISLLEFE